MLTKKFESTIIKTAVRKQKTKRFEAKVPSPESIAFRKFLNLTAIKL